MTTAKKFTAAIFILIVIFFALLVFRVANAEPTSGGYFWITSSNCNKAEARWDHDGSYSLWTEPIIYSECWGTEGSKWVLNRQMTVYQTTWDAGAQLWHEYFRTADYAPMMNMQCYDVYASMQIRTGTLIEVKRSDNANIFNWDCKFRSLPLIINDSGNQGEMMAYPAPQSLPTKDKKSFKGNPYP